MMELILVLASIIAISTSVVMIMLFYHGFRYVPFVPTKRAIVKKMVALADVQEGESVVDLGCGDGRFLMESLRDKNNVNAKGVEVSQLLCLLARLRLWKAGKQAEIKNENFFKTSLKEADVIYCYLFPKTMGKLSKKFKDELKQGARVISYCFKIPDWQPAEVLQTIDDKPNNFLIYRYDIPEAYES